MSALSTASMRARFVEDGVSAASPQVLLIKLYDRLMTDLRSAGEAMAAGDRQAWHNRLVNAQGIVTALAVALEGAEWDGRTRLQALYQYLLTQLAQANVHGDAARVATCLSLVEPLREAWFQASVDLASAALPASAAAPSIGTTA